MPENVEDLQLNGCEKNCLPTQDCERPHVARECTRSCATDIGNSSSRDSSGGVGDSNLRDDDDEDDEDVNWLECISAIETPRGLLYFCDKSYAEKNDALQPVADLADCWPTIGAASATHLYSITAYNPHNKIRDKLQNELANAELKGELTRLFPGCQLYNNFSFFPSRPHHFERGYTVAIPLGYAGGADHGRIVHDLAKRYEQAAFFKCTMGSDGRLVPCVVLVQGQYSEMEESLSAIRRVAVHPAFLHDDNNALSASLDDALKVMGKCVDTPHATELLDVFHRHHHLLLKPVDSGNGERQPFLVVEGFGAAESADRIAKAIGAEHCSWLPQCVAHLYPAFQNTSTHLMAAFRIITNYLQAALVSQKLKDTCVVMDRYWYDTLASIIVAEVGVGASNLPPRTHEVYEKWPSDLLQPDVVVWIKSSGRRLPSKRRLIEPSDRVSNGVDLPVKTNLAHETFRRMQDRTWIAVSGGSAEEVALRVLDELMLRKLIALDHLGWPAACPSGASPPPAPTHDILHGRPQAANAYGEQRADGGKPFWF